MKEDIIKKANQLLTPALIFHTDIVVKKARGLYVEDVSGKRYMDFSSGLATTNIGHCHPRVVAAVKKQMEEIIHSGCIFRYNSEVILAERLKEITPGNLDMFFFSNSGAEAVEGAIKLARFVTKRQGINPDEVAAIIIEPVLGEGGYAVPPADYLKELRKLCTEYGILLIADEVQTGFGRAGKWFAVEHFGVVPDIMTIAKGIASGFPLSAVVSTKVIMSKWMPGAHGTTFGGNPVSCAAGIATIETIKKDKLLENAAKVGKHAILYLKDMQKKYPVMGDVRGLGFMIGIEFVKHVPSGTKTGKDKSPDREFLKKVLNRCYKKGLILIECGIDKNIIRFMPPLIITMKEMEKALEIFEQAMAKSS